MDHAAPLIIFALATLLFMGAGLTLGSVLPMQVALPLAQLSALMGSALWYRHVRPPPDEGWPTLRRLKMPPWGILAALLTGALMGLYANLLGAFTLKLIPSLQAEALRQSANSRALLFPEEPALAVAAIIAIVITAPLCEELLFRGAILPTQQRRPLLGALALNGGLFALIHFNLPAALPLALLGAFLAHLTLRSRSLWPAILVHAGVNLCNGVLLPRLVLADAQGELDLDALPWTSLLVGMLLLGALCASLWRAMLTLARDPTP